MRTATHKTVDARALLTTAEQCRSLLLYAEVGLSPESFSPRKLAYLEARLDSIRSLLGDVTALLRCDAEGKGSLNAQGDKDDDDCEGFSPGPRDPMGHHRRHGAGR